MTLPVRALPWRALLLVVAVAATLVGVRPEPAMLRVAAVMLAAAAALCCDDPAEAVTDATPTPRLVRRGLRWVAGTAYAFACCLALLQLVDGVAVGAAARELAVLLTLTLACGTVVGGAGATPALAVLLLADDLFAHLLGSRAGHLRDAALLVACVVLANALRDPAARTRRLAPADTKVAASVGAISRGTPPPPKG